MKRGVEIGVDIVEIDRIARQIRNKRFLARVFSSEEVVYCRSHKKYAQHFAVRFAAKEAVWKALSGFLKKRTLGHRDIQVKNQLSGKPEVRLPAKFADLQKGLKLSLSHGRAYAVAVALYDPSKKNR